MERQNGNGMVETRHKAPAGPAETFTSSLAHSEELKNILNV